MEDYQEAMLKSLVAVAWADGKADAEEMEVIEALLSAFDVHGKDADALREWAKTPHTLADVPLTELSSDDRRLLLQHAMIVTYVDGKHTDDERKTIDELAKKLRIPDAEAKELIEQSEVRAKRLLEFL